MTPYSYDSVASWCPNDALDAVGHGCLDRIAKNTGLKSNLCTLINLPGLLFSDILRGFLSVAGELSSGGSVKGQTPKRMVVAEVEGNLSLTTLRNADTCHLDIP